MNTTTIKIQPTEKRIAHLAILGGPLLEQVTRQLGSQRYKAGKDAYDFLGNMLGKPAAEIQVFMSCMGIPSIRERDLNNDVEAALAVAAAALADCARGVRVTPTERIEKAMRILDDELSASL